MEEKHIEYNRRRTGMNFEEMAGEYLKQQGYLILEYNFHSKFGEIDIIAEDGEYLVFCEVKFRSGEGSGIPEEAVNYQKQRRISKTALYYLHAHHYRIDETCCRFDVVCIEGQQITVYKDAFPYVGE